MLTILAAALLLLVSPRQSFAPATLTIRLQVEPAEANRLVRLTLDNGEYFRSTDLDLEGAAARKTQAPITYGGVPAGDYLLRAQVFNSVGKVIASTQTTVHVEGME